MARRSSALVFGYKLFCYGLGTLVIYTAGTEHARVHLPGLDHRVALRIRDHLLARMADDVV